MRMPSASHGLESRRATTRSACAPLASALARSVGGEYIASTRARFWECGARKFGDVGYAAQASGGGLGTAGHRVHRSGDSGLECWGWDVVMSHPLHASVMVQMFVVSLRVLACTRGIACCRRSGC